MAKLLLANGEVKNIEPANPANGFELDELYNLIECRIVELVHLSNGKIMLIDEEGRLQDNAVKNSNASTLYQTGRMTNTEYIALLRMEYGDNLIVCSTEMDNNTDPDCIYGHAIVCDPHEFR